MTPHSIGSATISFGLVSIPIKLYTAAASAGVSFNLLHAKCGRGLPAHPATHDRPGGEPLTDEGRGWVEDHVRADITGFGPALGVAQRGIADMLPGISIAGLGVERV